MIVNRALQRAIRDCTFRRAVTWDEFTAKTVGLYAEALTKLRSLTPCFCVPNEDGIVCTGCPIDYAHHETVEDILKEARSDFLWDLIAWSEFKHLNADQEIRLLSS